MKINIDFSDGLFSFTEHTEGEHEVPDELVQMWKSADEINKVIQKQLQALDNSAYAKKLWPKDKSKPRNPCYYCDEETGEPGSRMICGPCVEDNEGS